MADPRPKNPFLHTHDHDHDHGHHHHHGHDHDHDDELIEELDPAQQSLSDALRVSFNILKGIMLLLVVVYCFTGIFSVDASEVAVRLRFGKIVGDATGASVYGPGWHFGWPYPIEQKIYVPVATQRTIPINNTFWFQTTEATAGQTLDQIPASEGGLNPLLDGSLITGEANIVHAQFDVKYRITDAVAYVTSVGSLEMADRLVRAASEEGVVTAVAASDTDSVLQQSRALAGRAREHAQRVLDGMQTGITITGDPNDPQSASGIIVRTPTMPLNVRPAYYEGNNAESERAQQVADARSERTTRLNAAAGPAHDELFRLIQSYEYHHAAGDAAMAGQVGEVLDAAFDELSVNGQPIGGDVARIINEARGYRTSIVAEARTDAETFRARLATYRQNPQLIRRQLWLEAAQTIFTGDVETFHAVGVPYIVINSDPQLKRQRDQQRIQQAQQAGQTQPQR